MNSQRSGFPLAFEGQNSRVPRAAIFGFAACGALMASLTGCEGPADPRADFAAAAELCVTTLSSEPGSSDSIREAGWSNGQRSAADDGPKGAVTNQSFTKGVLTIALDGASRDRCFVEGPPEQVGSLDDVKTTLSRTFGKPTPETRGTFRWKVEQQNLLVKLQQLNTQSGEIIRVYVFRPNANLIGGLAS